MNHNFRSIHGYVMEIDLTSVKRSRVDWIRIEEKLMVLNLQELY